MNKMKRYLFILVAAAAMLTACQEKKESTVIIAPKPEPVKPSGPILMQDMKAENSVLTERNSSIKNTQKQPL